MSDNHTGLSHDMPEYVPNLRRKAKVFKQGHWWRWQHHCAWKNYMTDGYPQRSQSEALAGALKHMEGCW